MATSAARQVARLQQTNLGVKALGKSPVRRVKAASGMMGQQGLTVGIGAMQFWLGSRAHTGGYQRWELRRRRRHDNGRERERRFHAFRGGGLRGRQVHNGQRERVNLGSQHWRRWLRSGGSNPSQAQATARSQPGEVPSLSLASGGWKVGSLDEGQFNGGW